RAPYDYEMVKKYCKDGDQIQEIEISHADLQLPRQVVIMDTPGIDSAEDAHRIATESAIHLADIIFYVMDYNHVQSELNFRFTRELAEAGKEIYLVINQVDKHSEQELSFADFKKSVIESFALWGVKSVRVFYTSLKEETHEQNQFMELQKFLAKRLKEKDGLLRQSIVHSLQKISKDHIELIKKTNVQVLQPFQDILAELSAVERGNLVENYNHLCVEKNALVDINKKAEDEFFSAVRKILDNAYLMPFQTRELAKFYLASCQSGFKVGLFFRKHKTQKVRQERLHAFYQAILEKTKSQVEWPLKDFLLRFLKEKRIEEKNLLARVSGFEVDFSSEVVTNAVKTGARLSDTSVINYTENVADEIKHSAEISLNSLKYEILKVLQNKNADRQVELAKKQVGLERYITAIDQVKKHEAAESFVQAKFEALPVAAEQILEDHLCLFNFAEDEVEIIEGETLQPEQITVEKNTLKKKTHREKKLVTIEPSDRMKDTAGKLRKTADLIRDLPGFKKTVNELEQKATRLEYKGFTVAMFGAFSAGKSSFANALIGARVLPVSPNPTTAAINRIKPIDMAHSHGMVVVKLKTEQVMLEDVNRALKLFDFQVNSLAEVKTVVKRIDAQSRQDTAEKTNYIFLQAFIRGYAAFYERLGTVLETTLTEFSDYVAKEEKSCFVEWIDLYYDCSLTRKGITLVDTPGADSINSRHTSVAFEFIRNADAILFVTYYNHAFSRADREFLIQLGRVKDSFQLDKMFFMINAIDLAENEEEKESVVSYVCEQLIKYGIRKPQVYPLSSLYALQGKQEGKVRAGSGLPAFEESFYHFITNDLADLATAASENELKRIYHLLEKLIMSTKEIAAVKKQKQASVESEKVRIYAILAQETVGNLKQRINQETKELVYYTKQRVFLRFNEFFKEAFNPVDLCDDGRNLKKALENALAELLEKIGFDFSQEMRATTVRMDRFAEKIIAEQQMVLVEMIQKINPDIVFSSFESEDKTTIQFEEAFKDVQRGLFVEAMTYFKNPKAFFEKQENKVMCDTIYRVLDTEADIYLKKEQDRIQVLYRTAMNDAFGKMTLQMMEQINDFYLSLIAAMDGDISAEHLIKMQRCLEKFI
ncbi:MAG: dynamin family protein, partial [Selenomonadaceae bacterium]